jgi:signal transduction histidine kinase
MKIRTRRSYVFALATVMLALFLVWAGRTTWRELRQLHRSFDSLQEDVFHLSEYIDASFDDISDIVLRFDPQAHPEDRAAFQKKSQDLEQWIHARQPSITTLQERELMDKIAEALELYVSQSTKLMDEAAQARRGASLTRRLERTDTNAIPVLNLCEKLKTVEHAAQAQFMEESRRALVWLQELLAAQIGLLVFLAGTATLAVYRSVIAPLRVELDESRVRAARHEKLASLGTLAAGVAHEIRNPLTAINVRLHSLKRNLLPNSSEQEDATVIGHEIQRLENIVQEFLHFARPREPKLVTVSADSLLARMQALFGPQLEKTSIRLNVEPTPDIGVRVDPHQLEQVLINLIQNAIESIKDEGAITLRVRTGIAHIHGGSRPVIRLEVSDTGPGIPPEVRKRMFDPFFTTKEEGTGLGLAIASRIVEKHGGSLECSSEVDRGTTFVILLPSMKSEETDESST